MLRERAGAHPDRIAIVDPTGGPDGGRRTWTYGELDLWADRMAAGLTARGIGAGDKVVVQLPNVAAFFEVVFGLFRIGALPVFALPAHRRTEIGYFCSFTGAVAYVIPAAHGGFDYRELAAQVREDAPELRHVFVTGGDPGAFTALSEVPLDPDPEPPVHGRPAPHDLQNYFLSSFDTASEPFTGLLRQASRLREEAIRADVPIFYTAQQGGQSAEERGLQQDFWGPGLPLDPEAEAIASAVSPGPGDTVLTKWKYSAFVRTDLLERLRALGRDQLVITGVYAHIGVLMTACDAWMQDVQAFVVADAVADFSAQEHRMALEWAAGRCAYVTTTDRVCEAW